MPVPFSAARDNCPGWVGRVPLRDSAPQLTGNGPPDASGALAMPQLPWHMTCTRHALCDLAICTLLTVSVIIKLHLIFDHTQRHQDDQGVWAFRQFVGSRHAMSHMD